MRGRFSHNLDAKGRIFVPAKLREVLGDSFVVASVMEPCICLYTSEGFDDMLAKLREHPMTEARDLERYLSSNAEDVKVDSQGRILLPKHLIQSAGLVKEALVIGAATDRAEIWNPDTYNEKVGSLKHSDIFKKFAALGL